MSCIHFLLLLQGIVVVFTDISGSEYVLGLHLLCLWLFALRLSAYPHFTAIRCFWHHVCCISLCCHWRECLAFIVKAGLAAFHQSFHKLLVNQWHKWIQRLHGFLLVSYYFLLLYERTVWVPLAISRAGIWMKTERLCQWYCYKVVDHTGSRQCQWNDISWWYLRLIGMLCEWSDVAFIVQACFLHKQQHQQHLPFIGCLLTVWHCNPIKG